MLGPQLAKDSLVLVGVPDLRHVQEVGDALEYRSRLSLEVGQAILKSQSNQDGTTVGLKVYRVEAVEHLPSQTRQSSHDAAVLADVRQPPVLLPHI